MTKNCDGMIHQYWEAVEATSKFKPSLGFCLTASGKVKKQNYSILTLREQELHDWIDMVVMENWSLNCVANPRCWSFGRGQSNFGIDTVRNVILAMTVEVEQILTAEMQAAGKRSIVYDVWSKFGSHFFALFATYKAMCEVVEDGVCKAVTEPVISLLSVAPLHTPVKEAVQGDGFLPAAEEAEVEESNNFTAQAHANHIIDKL